MLRVAVHAIADLVMKNLLVVAQNEQLSGLERGTPEAV